LVEKLIKLYHLDLVVERVPLQELHMESQILTDINWHDLVEDKPQQEDNKKRVSPPSFFINN